MASMVTIEYTFNSVFKGIFKNMSFNTVKHIHTDEPVFYQKVFRIWRCEDGLFSISGLVGGSWCGNDCLSQLRHKREQELP